MHTSKQLANLFINVIFPASFNIVILTPTQHILTRTPCSSPSSTRGLLSLAHLSTAWHSESANAAAKEQFKKLADKLQAREYREDVTLAGIARARAVTREEDLKKVVRAEAKGSRQHRLIVEYDRRSSPALSTVLEANYQQMLARDQR